MKEWKDPTALIWFTKRDSIPAIIFHHKHQAASWKSKANRRWLNVPLGDLETRSQSLESTLLALSLSPSTGRLLSAALWRGPLGGNGRGLGQSSWTWGAESNEAPDPARSPRSRPEGDGRLVDTLTAVLRGARKPSYAAPTLLTTETVKQMVVCKKKNCIKIYMMNVLSCRHLSYRNVQRHNVQVCSLSFYNRNRLKNLIIDQKLVTYNIHTNEYYINELQISKFSFIQSCKIQQTCPKLLSVRINKMQTTFVSRGRLSVPSTSSTGWLRLGLCPGGLGASCHQGLKRGCQRPLENLSFNSF